VPTDLPAETAYYYPEPFWGANEGSWIKSLLLFFDDVAILLPEYMRGRHIASDPTLAGPLEDQGLLKVLEPEWFVDEDATKLLVEMVQWLIEQKAFDDLPPLPPAQLSGSRFGYGSARPPGFVELSKSRMGNALLHEATNRVFKALASRGLAVESEDGVSIPMHPFVRATYLVLLAQLARTTGARHGLELLPTTNGRGVVDTFKRYLELPPMPSKGNVITFDLEAVSIDLSNVPLDEVLEFRTENLDAHRRYMQNLRAFSAQISGLDEAERARAFAERKDELASEANDLMTRARKAWKSPKDVATFALGLTGAAWTLAAHNLLPGLLTVAGAALSMVPGKDQGTAFSYLFKAKGNLAR
jgi:hypothetical protein